MSVVSVRWISHSFHRKVQSWLIDTFLCAALYEREHELSDFQTLQYSNSSSGELYDLKFTEIFRKGNWFKTCFLFCINNPSSGSSFNTFRRCYTAHNESHFEGVFGHNLNFFSYCQSVFCNKRIFFCNPDKWTNCQVFLSLCDNL